MVSLNLSAPSAPPAPVRPSAGFLARAGGAFRAAVSRGAALTAAAVRATDYTSMVLKRSFLSVSGGFAGETETAAKEIVGRRVARVFQTARLRTGNRALARVLTPGCLGYIARRVAIDGGVLLIPYGRGDGGVLIPAYTWEIDRGGADPDSWTYQVHVASPSGMTTGVMGRRDVFHVFQDPDPDEPWEGTSAAGSIAAAQLPAAARRGLVVEQKVPVNRLIPSPKTTKSEKDGQKNALESDLAEGGSVKLVETMSTGYVGDRGGAPMGDWNPRRLGPDPTDVQASNWFASEGALMAAMGMHPSMMDGRAPAAAVREARRQFQEECEAIARLIEAEVLRVFEVEVEIWWRAPDDVELVRARTADALVKIGVEPKDALRAAGFRDSLKIKRLDPPPVQAPAGGPPAGKQPPQLPAKAGR